MSNFITNEETTDLKKRLIELISRSDELKFLVGFFYFSGKANVRTTVQYLIYNIAYVPQRAPLRSGSCYFGQNIANQPDQDGLETFVKGWKPLIHFFNVSKRSFAEERRQPKSLSLTKVARASLLLYICNILVPACPGQVLGINHFPPNT